MINEQRPEQPTTGFVKSSYSSGGSGNCVEVARTASAVWVRDSKDLARPAFRVGAEAWGAFLPETR
ncbi:DUF397 domain-containing protein [Streptomyces sp. SID11385]|uniref:DUF397 domain-containing protein n=1 Tax=Streptomyces sp. SID11385 TaxID=2706031 RepID=UPI0013C71167|nr:DUF397 domain-containing protein [Streptomyces sp. SID11385]